MLYRIVVIGLAGLLSSCQTVEMPTNLGGHTVLHYDQGHGVQVEYFATNGRTYLWYPGNDRRVPGKWETRSNGNEICFAYPSNTYDPVAKEYMKGWKCRSMAKYSGKVRSTCKGDPFGLAGGRIPYVLDRSRQQLAKLQEKCS